MQRRVRREGICNAKMYRGEIPTPISPNIRDEDI
jgi:hypothetical protein